MPVVLFDSEHRGERAKSMMDKKIIAILVGLLIFDAALGAVYYTQTEAGKEYDLSVVVTIPPQEEFVEEVGGEDVKVTVMVPPGRSPHSYEPTYEQMKQVSKADIYFKLGSGIAFEKRWMDTIRETNRDMTIVDGSQGCTLLNLDGKEIETKQGYTVDPHTWLSLDNAKSMVQNLAGAMKDEGPDNADLYTANADSYIHRLNSTDANITEELAPYMARKFITLHPSFGYSAHDYDLTQVSIEVEGKDPGPKQVQKIIDEAKRMNISTIFVSPQFDESDAQIIAEEIGGDVRSLNPLAADYLSNIRDIANKIESSFGGESG